MVLTAYIVLSPVTGLFCHRRLQATACKLDASVGASGPHDFAVRVSAARLATPPRPPHPAPNVRDDREAPLLVRTGRREVIADLGVRSTTLSAANWHDGQFAHNAHAQFSLCPSGKSAAQRVRLRAAKTDRMSSATSAPGPTTNSFQSHLQKELLIPVILEKLGVALDGTRSQSLGAYNASIP
jgi:hypothetical protein